MPLRWPRSRAVIRSIALILGIAAAASIGRPAHGDAPAAAAVKKSLAGMDGFINQALRDWKAPGVAVAVVKNGEVIFAQGYGWRDVEKKLPVTTHTLFAIGSCTKAFTTFVMGTLVDEGKLDWDQPVRLALPELRMQDKVASELMTPRDLVTHRSGLPRHDLVWYNSTLSRKQMVERLPYLEATESFRSKFQYNNLMYVTAGYLIERLTGTTWEDAIRARILLPLGMSTTNFSVSDSQKSADFARPYEERDDKVVAIPFRNADNVGPAGSINSNVAEMARWLIVQTNKGQIDGKKIISLAELADIQTPHMTTGTPPERPDITPAGYALGWAVDDYRGHRRVHHGGAIDGFVASTTLFPDDESGLVVLANMGGTGLTQVLTKHLSDRVLGLSTIDWNGEALSKKAKNDAAAKQAKTQKNSVRRLGTSPAHKLDEYVGDYEHPGYGVIKIALCDGRLNLTYNRIDAPLEHWHFETFSALKNPKDPEFEDKKVQFLTNFNGDVEGLAVSFEPRLKPLVFTLRPDAKLTDPTYLKRFAGDYDLGGDTLHIRLAGNTLNLEMRGRSTTTLVPDRNDGFAIKGQSDTALRFVTTATDQTASAVTLATPGGVFTAKRKAK